MDKFDDLKNINENIENELKKRQAAKSEKDSSSKIDSLNLCKETINKTTDIHLTEENIKSKKLIINENSDIRQVKELLITLNGNEIMQDKIKKLSLRNLSNEDLKYIFIEKTNNKNKINKDTKNDKNQEILEENSKENNNNIKYNYPFITCKNCDCSNFKFCSTFIFPQLKKLKLISCEIPFSFITLNDSEFFNNITEFYFENCNLTNEIFKEIFYGILNNVFMKKNLKVLSFKNNKISIVSVYDFMLAGEMNNYKLDGLQFLDLSNNNINSFNFNLFNRIQKIQVIDFSNNNLHLKHKIDDLYKIQKIRRTIDIEAKTEKINKEKPNDNNSELLKVKAQEIEANTQIAFLFLLAGNIVLNNEEELEKYCKFLIEEFPKIDFPLRSLNFSGIFYKKNLHQYLYKMDLLNYQNSLIEIDLSICNLTDVEVSKLFMKEFLLKNLKKINLSSNNLTDDLFKLLIENNSHEVYNKLKEINLSNNPIYLNRIKEMIIFSKLFDCLEKILLCDTPGEEIINNYIKKKIIRFNEEQNNKKISTEFNKDELIVKELLENNSKNIIDTFGNKSKIKLYFNNNIDYKFIEASKKLYPELFDKVQIKCSNNYFN